MAEIRVPKGSDTVLISPVFTDTDEVAADLDDTDVPTVTVTSLREAGTLAAPTATNATGTGVYQCVLTAADHLTDLDVLTVTWAGVVDGLNKTVTQTVWVTGGSVVSIPELRAVPFLADTATRPTASLKMYRSMFEGIAARARGTEFVPCLASVTVSGNDRCRVRVPHRNVHDIVSVTVDGVARNVTDFEATGRHIEWVQGAFPATRPNNVTIVYAHGHLEPPAAIVEACKEFVRAVAAKASSDQQRNVIGFTDPATGATYRYGTADWRAGRFTGLTEVDDLLNAVADERLDVA